VKGGGPRGTFEGKKNLGISAGNWGVVALKNSYTQGNPAVRGRAHANGGYNQWNMYGGGPRESKGGFQEKQPSRRGELAVERAGGG